MGWYNEIDGFRCAVLRARMADGRLPPGKAVERDVRTVQPREIPDKGQVHLFAGIGGFGRAARLAGLPDGFDLWTAGFPCQDISTAGRGAGLSGARSGLFFEIVRLLRGVRRRPAWLLLENVPALRTRGYDRLAAELEGLGYAVSPLVVGAWAVGAPQRRNRVWIVGRLADHQGRRTRSVSTRPRHAGPGTRNANGSSQELADAEGAGRKGADPAGTTCAERWTAEHGWPARPGEPQHEWEAPRLLELPVGDLVDGIPVRLVRRANRDALKAYGDSIVPQVAAVVMRAIMAREKEAKRE
jgi:DNA (cytosine-5)-methyltransferase 1